MATMKSIILHAHEVRKLIDTGEVQIRRAVKPQPNEPTGGSGFDAIRWFSGVARWCWSRPHGGGFVRATEVSHYPYWKCPHGVPGTRLFVKETFSSNHSTHLTNQNGIIYRASWDKDGDEYDRPFENERRWRSSTHMPRWASRLDVEVVAVRVEKVQAIDEAEALTETAVVGGAKYIGAHALQIFREAWDSRNPKNPWDKDPYVWVSNLKMVTA